MKSNTREAPTVTIQAGLGLLCSKICHRLYLVFKYDDYINVILSLENDVCNPCLKTDCILRFVAPRTRAVSGQSDMLLSVNLGKYSRKHLKHRKQYPR